MPALKGKFMILSIEENHTPRSTVPQCHADINITLWNGATITEQPVKHFASGAYFDLRRSLFVSKDIAQAIGSFAGMVLCEA